MAVPSGIGAQFAIAEESVYGTYVAPTRAYPLVSETLKNKIQRIQSKGIRAGRLSITTNQWQAGQSQFDGDVNLELENVSMGLLWKHAMGAATLSTGRTVTDGVTVNTSPVVTSATAAFANADVGQKISGSGIPNNTTISQVVSATTVVMSANATAGASGVSVTIGTVGANVIVATPADLTGKSLSVQVGRPDIGGTSRAFSYTGCKINKWSLACKAGEVASFKASLVGQAESTAQALVTPYYPVGTRSVTDGATNTNTTVTSNTAKFTSNDIGASISGGSIVAGSTITAVGSATSVTISQAAGSTATGVSLTIGNPAMSELAFVGGFLTIAGTQLDIRDVTLNGDNLLDPNRFFLRNAASPKEPLANGLRVWNGTLTCDFNDLTAYNRYVNGTEAAMVLNFVGGQIAATGVSYSLVVTMNVRFDGDTPDVPGPAILTQTLPFVCTESGATDATAIQIAYTTSDTQV